MLLQWRDFLRPGAESNDSAFRRDLRTTAPYDPITPVTGRRSMNML